MRPAPAFPVWRRRLLLTQVSPPYPRPGGRVALQGLVKRRKAGRVALQGLYRGSSPRQSPYRGPSDQPRPDDWSPRGGRFPRWQRRPPRRPAIFRASVAPPYWSSQARCAALGRSQIRPAARRPVGVRVRPRRRTAADWTRALRDRKCRPGSTVAGLAQQGPAHGIREITPLGAGLAPFSRRFRHGSAERWRQWLASALAVRMCPERRRAGRRCMRCGAFSAAKMLATSFAHCVWR